jgi:hypothetical protein
MHCVNIPISRVSVVRRAVGRFLFACTGAFLGAGLIAPVEGQDRAIVFDIPTQSLAQALDAYGRATGMAALVDQGLTAGHRSAAVKGVLTPDQALRVLVAGTGLAIRYASRDAFTLEAEGAPANSDPHIADAGNASSHENGAYFADLQDTLVQALCRQPKTRPGRYRLGIQLWIGADGMVRASHLLDSSDDPGRDAAIADLLSVTPVAPPPAILAQPVTIVLLPHQSGEMSDCRPDAGRSE